jgi:RNA polymerase sigma-70 factor (ECF subfamily)
VTLGVEGVRTTDPSDGFDEHYAALYGPLVHYCRRITQHVDPEDLAQEALLRAWPSYVEGRDMWPLVVTIAKRMAIDAHRRDLCRQVRNHVEAEFRPSQAPTPEETLERHEEAQLARRALDQLSPRYQRLIRLRDIDERSYVDIAQLEGTSLDVARSTLRRARAALRAAYGRASEGAAAIFGLREWAARRSGRIQSTLGPLTNQGLTTLAGAVAVIAVAAGVAGGSNASTVTTTSTPHASGAMLQAGTTGRPGGGAAPSSVVDGLGADGGRASDALPADVVIRPDKVVGPVGIGGDEYGKHKTEDAEITVELDVGGQVLVGVYANPGTLFTDPAQPLEEEPS